MLTRLVGELIQSGTNDDIDMMIGLIYGYNDADTERTIKDAVKMEKDQDD